MPRIKEKNNTTGGNEPIQVLKLNLAGEVTFKYEGTVLRRAAHEIELEAFFNRSDLTIQGVVLKEGDRFVETYFNDRWYNIFEIFDRADNLRKGWYCNICKPAKIEQTRISYVDLALDLWVAADGTQTVLDRDEFERLELDGATVAAAWAGLAELQKRFDKKKTLQVNHGGLI